MAGIKISALPGAASANLTDVFPADQLPGPVTRKIALSQVISLFNGSFVQLAPSADQTITGAHNLIMATGSMVAPTMLPGNLTISGNTIGSTLANGQINIVSNTPNGFIYFGGTNPVLGQILLEVAYPGYPGSLNLAGLTNDTSAPTLYFSKSRSTTAAGRAAVHSGDSMLSIFSFGDDGTNYVNAGGMLIQCADTVSTGVMPSQILFRTTNSSGVQSTALTITKDQTITLANPLSAANGGTGLSSLGTGVATALGLAVTGSGGIALKTSPAFTTPSLGAATATSINFGGSALANYVQFGSWTPVFTFATPGDLSVVYTAQTGYYTRIGNVIYASFIITCTPTFTTSASNFIVTGLPVTSNSGSNNNSFGTVDFSHVTFPTGCTNAVCLVSPSAAQFGFLGNGSAVASAPFTPTQFTSGVAVTVAASVFYFA